MIKKIRDLCLFNREKIRYTREDGELDQEHMLMDLAIQNQMIIESLKNLKKLI